MDQNAKIIRQAITGSLEIIDQDREKEIISRRFGLTGQKETLEQIGDMLSITRERVRQLEKAILIRLHINAEDKKIPELVTAEKLLIRNLAEMGRAARISELANKIYGHKATAKEKAYLSFIGGISANLTLIDETDKYYASLVITDSKNPREILKQVDAIVKTIKENKAPLTLDQLDQKLDYEHPDHIKAIASISKSISTLNNLWGLAKWPTVNPKNIRDKIFVVLENEKQPMHFSDIAKAIANSNFKRKNVTTQAIHNELIKDPRFVLIGRGIYALDSWGYSRGTVSEIITKVLSATDRPLTREEIVKQVLRSRKVKETTILLNLQNKKLFTKVDKNTYTTAQKS